MNVVTDVLPVAAMLALAAGIAWLAVPPVRISWLWLTLPFAWSWCLGAPGVLLPIVALVVTVILRRQEVLSAAVFRGVTAAVSVGAILVIAAQHHQRLAHLDELRAEYPFASVAPRLAYESAAAKSIAEMHGIGKSDSIEQGYLLLENAQCRAHNYSGSTRCRTLAMLHERVFDTFARADGFGVMRGGYYDPDDVQLPPVDPIRLVCEPPVLNDGPPAKPLEVNQLTDLHWNSTGDFLQMSRIGYVRDREHVAGFQPHALSETPKFKRQPEQSWHVTMVALVSLLKHAEPCVYETENLPNLKELSSLNAPTRPLDMFEADALRQLWTDRDVIIDDTTPNHIRMLGALRAAEGCRECHEVPQGTLLGAFTYRLSPGASAAATARSHSEIRSILAGDNAP